MLAGSFVHRWLARWRERLARRVEADMVERFLVRDIPVAVLNTRPDIDTSHVLARLDAALEVVERFQPHRLRRMRRDVAEIWVRRYPCRAAFYPDARACLVELTFLVNPAFTPSQLAASIVHEATHARIHAMGLRLGPADRAREERLCRKAELELGLLVPDGAPVVERALASLELADEEVAPTIDWSEAARRIAEVDGRA